MPKKPVFWVNGNYYDCRTVIDQILEKYGRNNVTILDGSSDSVERVFANLVETDLFAAGTKVIRLRGLPPDYTLIVDYLKYVGKNRVLIIEAPFNRTAGARKTSASKTNLFKAIKKDGKIYDFPVIIKTDKARNWAITVSENENKKKLESNAADLLVKLKHCNLDQIFLELDKLSTYIGKRRKITVEDVSRCVLDSNEFNVWSLVDHVTDSNLQESIAVLEDLWRQKNFIYLLEPLVGGLIARFKLLLFAREIGGINAKTMFSYLSEFKKKAKDSKNPPVSTYNIRSLSSFSYSKVVKDAHLRMGTVRITEILDVLYFTQNSLRALGSVPASSRLLITNMVETLCGRISVRDFFGCHSGRNGMMVSTI